MNTENMDLFESKKLLIVNNRTELLIVNNRTELLIKNNRTAFQSYTTTPFWGEWDIAFTFSKCFPHMLTWSIFGEKRFRWCNWFIQSRDPYGRRAKDMKCFDFSDNLDDFDISDYLGKQTDPKFFCNHIPHSLMSHEIIWRRLHWHMSCSR